ncbi:mucin-1-like [Pecten maximus]|uniref:mucin-1-like n=1 Tax=Pecten maximus TaxID=6579 RepID=UPI0014588CB9|nr:mucin-1-like [Pecten maximus]
MTTLRRRHSYDDSHQKRKHASSVAPPPDSSSADSDQTLPAFPSSASSHHVVMSSSHVSWDKSDLSDASLSSMEQSIKVESQVDSSYPGTTKQIHPRVASSSVYLKTIMAKSWVDTEQIRPTSSSKYLHRTNTDTYDNGRIEKEGESSRKGKLEVTTYEEEIRSSEQFENTNDQGTESSPLSDDYAFHSSNPHVKLYTVGVDDIDSLADFYLTPSAVDKSEVTTMSAFDESEIFMSAFESVDSSFDTFQTDHVFLPSVVELYASGHDYEITSSAQNEHQSTSPGRATSARDDTSSALDNANAATDNTTSVLENASSVLPNTSSALGNATSALDNATSALANTTSGLGNATSALDNTTSALGNTTSGLGNVTSALDNATSTSVAEAPMCRCACHYAANLKLYRNATAVNITSDQVQKTLKKQVTNLQKQLSLNKTNLSSEKRKKTSMNDDRASARGVGLIGVVMLVLLMGGLVLMDLTTIKRDFQRLRDNLGHCCKENNSAC